MGGLKNPKPWSIFEYREVEDNRETATGKEKEKEKGPNTAAAKMS